MCQLLVFATVTLLVCSTIPATYQSAITEFSGIVRDIVALGAEDIKWSDYGEFGTMFAPAVSVAKMQKSISITLFWSMIVIYI